MSSLFTQQRQLLQMKSMAKPSLEKKAYQEIRNHIIHANYLPGTLLSENELADQLNMSRTPIRAAISLLEQEGFVESVRGRGVFVKNISSKEFCDMFEVLVSMQIYAFDVAEKRGLSFDLTSLRDHLDLQIEAADNGDHWLYYESSLLFIETILTTVHNQNMMQILEQIKGKYMCKVVSYRTMNPQSLSNPRQGRRINSRIYEALKQGNIQDAKEAIYEVNEILHQQLKQFDI
ncbi:GntR family transcriptional regulator [Paenibacillus sp. LjRoot56]|uniref:GntR family transcriptional regulator n=1 Tax=Paenibacillus sp. LjRoot56 TaxID=3342333 RepID=UPI003ECD4383